MTETLAEKKCTPCRGGIPPLTHEEAEHFQSKTPNWELRDDAHRIERTFRFRNFQEALGFVRNVGDLAETEGHPPISASAGVTRRSRCAPRRSRDCTRTILSWRASSIGCSIGRMTLPIISEVGKLEPWQLGAIVLSRFSAEPAFSAAVSFGIFVSTAFAFGLHQGIPTTVTCCVILMIRNFDRSRPTFMVSGQLPRRLLMLTAR